MPGWRASLAATFQTSLPHHGCMARAHAARVLSQVVGLARLVAPRTGRYWKPVRNSVWALEDRVCTRNQTTVDFAILPIPRPPSTNAVCASTFRDHYAALHSRVQCFHWVHLQPGPALVWTKPTPLCFKKDFQPNFHRRDAMSQLPSCQTRHQAGATRPA